MFLLFLLQISDISARIAALKSAGLNVDTQQARFTKTRTVPFMVHLYYMIIISYELPQRYVKQLGQVLQLVLCLVCLQPVTVDSSRQQRRRLPAPPVKGRSVS